MTCSTLVRGVSMPSSTEVYDVIVAMIGETVAFGAVFQVHLVLLLRAKSSPPLYFAHKFSMHKTCPLYCMNVGKYPNAILYYVLDQWLHDLTNTLIGCAVLYGSLL